jgi:transposase
MNKSKSRQEWETIVNTWKKSGKSQNNFCKENNISISTFGYWISKLKKKTESLELVKLPFPVKPVQLNTTINIRTTFCSILLEQEVDEKTLEKIFRSLQVVSI